MSNSVVEKKQSELKQMLVKREESLINVLGEQFKERFIENTLNLYGDPLLINVEPDSMYREALKIAQLKLSTVKEHGQAYVVPRKLKRGEEWVTEATTQLGYKGWLVLAERAGKTIETRIVYTCDEFNEVADENGLKYTYKANHADRPKTSADVHKMLFGALVWVFEQGKKTAVTFVNSENLKQRYEASKAAMRDKASPAWVNWAEEMYMAKAIKYVLTKMPIDVYNQNNIIAEAIVADENDYNDDEATQKPRVKVVQQVEEATQADYTDADFEEVPQEKKVENVNDTSIQLDTLEALRALYNDVPQSARIKHKQKYNYTVLSDLTQENAIKFLDELQGVNNG